MARKELSALNLDQAAADNAPAIEEARQTGLRVEHIARSFGQRQVVKDVSLTVQRGEVCGLLGPNGAGKTTCFYMITGLIPADSGSIWLDGEEITQHGHFACQTSRIGRRRTERLHDRRCGHGRRIGDDGLRQFGMGRLISGQLLLIFLLLPGTVNRETEKQNPDKYDAYD